tara:strand:- start:883 stop:1587 length:705 start_codon:yes stop_codon:yes gene_type:complete
MSDILEFETYLSVSSKKFEIYLFDIKNFKNLYEKKFNLNHESENIDLTSLTIFLEDNIFKIEKLIGKFIKEISIIIENKTILNIDLSVKKKNYNEYITNAFLENTLTDIKDLFKENYQENRLMHLIVNKYLVDGVNHLISKNKINTKEICLEVKLISILNSTTFELDKILKKYQIQVENYLDRNYIENFFADNQLELSEMTYKIKNGININEAKIISKYPKNEGFFEKFFQLFS